MLTNLVQNAIVHNLPGGGTVTVRTEAKRYASVLRVENTGRVLPADLVPTLTEPFQRGTQRTRADEHAGVGLGLAIVHSIVRAHDGHLELTPARTAACWSRSASPRPAGDAADAAVSGRCQVRVSSGRDRGFTSPPRKALR